MKFSISLSVLCLILIRFRVTSVSAQICMDNGYLSVNGTYHANRRLILSSLPSNVTAQPGLFYNGSIGQEPNRVYAVGMCIPGSDPSDCTDCIKTGLDGLIKTCPNQTSGYTCPGDPTLCYVRYSNTSFLGSTYLDPLNLVYNAGDINSNLTEFNKIWEGLIVNMISATSTTKSTTSSSDNHYSANITALSTFQDIYAMMLCTPDLSSRECENCLRQSVVDFQSCCSQKPGGVAVRPSCFFRWELRPYSKAFENIKVASPRPPPNSTPPITAPRFVGERTNTTDIRDSKGISGGIIAAITVPTVVIILVLFVLGLVLRRRKTPYKRTENESVSDTSTGNSSQYDFKTIEAATDNFSRSNKLGEGGFGEVYKGKLSNGTEIAVKRLSENSGQGTREFRNEAVLVSKLQHRNLVRLLGYCLKGEEKILIYEFVPNKSLDYFLFDPEKQGQLEWTQRYTIIEGITRGILYLHQDSQLTIIHRDLKASNILLDANMNPKISDFGLSTIFGVDQTRGNTDRIAGTYAYMPPEYKMLGQYSMKSDIYSFGVLVLEIISGKKNSRVYQIDETSTAGNLVIYAWRLWTNGSPLELVDPAFGNNFQINEVTRCIHIALLCVQNNPKNRPMLSTIMLMLSSNTMTLPMPRLLGDAIEFSQSTNRSGSQTINDVTITDLEPR